MVSNTLCIKWLTKQQYTTAVNTYIEAGRGDIPYCINPTCGLVFVEYDGVVSKRFGSLNPKRLLYCPPCAERLNFVTKEEVKKELHEKAEKLQLQFLDPDNCLLGNVNKRPKLSDIKSLMEFNVVP